MLEIAVGNSPHRPPTRDNESINPHWLQLTSELRVNPCPEAGKYISTTAASSVHLFIGCLCLLYDLDYHNIYHHIEIYTD